MEHAHIGNIFRCELRGWDCPRVAAVTRGGSLNPWRIRVSHQRGIIQYSGNLQVGAVICPKHGEHVNLRRALTLMSRQLRCKLLPQSRQ